MSYTLLWLVIPLLGVAAFYLGPSFQIVGASLHAFAQEYNKVYEEDEDDDDDKED